MRFFLKVKMMSSKVVVPGPPQNWLDKRISQDLDHRLVALIQLVRVIRIVQKFNVNLRNLEASNHIWL